MMNAEKALYDAAGGTPGASIDFRIPNKYAAKACGLARINSMTTASSSSSELRDLYAEESARIRQEFASTGNGCAAVTQRTALVEQIALVSGRK